MQHFKVEYLQSKDILLARLADETQLISPTRYIPISDHIILRVDASGKLIGFEILDFSVLRMTDVLTTVPEPSPVSHAGGWHHLLHEISRELGPKLPE